MGGFISKSEMHDLMALTALNTKIITDLDTIKLVMQRTFKGGEYFVQQSGIYCLKNKKVHVQSSFLAHNVYSDVAMNSNMRVRTDTLGVILV